MHDSSEARRQRLFEAMRVVHITPARKSRTGQETVWSAATIAALAFCCRGGLRLQKEKEKAAILAALHIPPPAL
jgi:hypothetical protein